MSKIKIYTKTGDKGYTNLYDMKKVRKDDMIFEVLGNLDELSAMIGLLCVEMEDNDKVSKDCIVFLRQIQSLILDMSSDIATTTNRDKIISATENEIKEVEGKIDFYHNSCVQLTEFLLPGTVKIESVAHICRTITRRSERSLWKLYYDYTDRQENFHVGQETFAYVNRLSDFFFAFARFYSFGKEYTRSMAKRKLLK